MLTLVVARNSGVVESNIVDVVNSAIEAKTILAYSSSFITNKLVDMWLRLLIFVMFV